MREIKLAYILRTVSILIAFLLIFLIIKLNALKDNTAADYFEGQSGKNYNHEYDLFEPSIPDFTYDLKSLFPRQVIFGIVEKKAVAKLADAVIIPDLKFIGMIETDNKRIFSFRNKNTNKLLLLEEEVSVGGFTLLQGAEAAEEKVFLIKKQDITFRVDKK